MERVVRRYLSILSIAIVLLFAVAAMGKSRVVIIPEISLLLMAKKDCNGDKDGTATTDNCSTCVGGNTGLTACIQDCNGDWDGTATIDNCSTCVGGNTGLTACIEDCNGDLDGTAYLDTCGTCVGGNTGGLPSVITCVSSAGQFWMDRNLGASQVATSSTDSAAYGDLYQWGRLTDGHEQRSSLTTTITSPNDVPGHGDFITTGVSPGDWRDPQNDNLWQGLGGINNPCPQGFRLPTYTELDTERQSWVTNDAAGAFASLLKLVVAGARLFSTGGPHEVDISGNYWSSSIISTSGRNLYFSSTSNSGTIYGNLRSIGFSVRCIKD